VGKIYGKYPTTPTKTVMQKYREKSECNSSRKMWNLKKKFLQDAKAKAWKLFVKFKQRIVRFPFMCYYYVGFCVLRYRCCRDALYAIMLNNVILCIMQKIKISVYVTYKKRFESVASFSSAASVLNRHHIPAGHPAHFFHASRFRKLSLRVRNIRKIFIFYERMVLFFCLRSHSFQFFNF
jgi:hypothetical protein